MKKSIEIIEKFISYVIITTRNFKKYLWHQNRKNILEFGSFRNSYPNILNLYFIRFLLSFLVRLAAFIQSGWTEFIQENS